LAAKLYEPEQRRAAADEQDRAQDRERLVRAWLDSLSSRAWRVLTFPPGPRGGVMANVISHRPGESKANWMLGGLYEVLLSARGFRKATHVLGAPPPAQRSAHA
jgi:hypothetical protein